MIYLGQTVLVQETNNSSSAKLPGIYLGVTGYGVTQNHVVLALNEANDLIEILPYNWDRINFLRVPDAESASGKKIEYGPFKRALVGEFKIKPPVPEKLVPYLKQMREYAKTSYLDGKK